MAAESAVRYRVKTNLGSDLCISTTVVGHHKNYCLELDKNNDLPPKMGLIPGTHSYQLGSTDKVCRMPRLTMIASVDHLMMKYH